MQGSRFRSLIAVAALSLAAAVSTAVSAVTFVVIAARDFAVDLFVKVAATFAEPQFAATPAARLVAARAYLARFVKRERPQLQARWRMCPST